MICNRCGVRGEYRDFSDEEHYYGMCDFCIAELRAKGELPPAPVNILEETLKQIIQGVCKKNEE